MISVCQSTVPIELLKKSIGHGKDIDTFRQYEHEIDGDLQVTARLVGEAFKAVLARAEKERDEAEQKAE